MYMIKLTGAFIVIITSCLIGVAAGEKQKEYINILISLKRCLVIIRSEIAYAYTPLMEIFTRLSCMKQEEWSGFFDEISEELKSGAARENDLFCMWKKTCISSQVCKKMTGSDVDELIRFGGVLGSTDREGQINNIEMFMESISDKINCCQKSISDKVRICHVLGAAAGFLITILLI